MEIKYPHVQVQLVGLDGNAFAILGRVQQAMKSANIPKAEISAFFTEATSDDYVHLLATVMRWVEVK